MIKSNHATKVKNIKNPSNHFPHPITVPSEMLGLNCVERRRERERERERTEKKKREKGERRRKEDE